MTWSINLTAPNKREAKKQAVCALGAQLGLQPEHGADLPLLINLLNGAIDVCDEGEIYVAAAGYLSIQHSYKDDKSISYVGGFCITNLFVSSNPAAEVQS